MEIKITRKFRRLWSRQESNLNQRLRRPLYYPLYYETEFLLRENKELTVAMKNYCTSVATQGTMPRSTTAGYIKIYLPKACTLVPNIFTAMANKITPKNLRTAIKPVLPKIFSSHLNKCTQIKIIARLIKMPISMY